MAPEMLPLATDWYSSATVACSPPELNSVCRSLSLGARHVRRHGLLAEARGVGRDVGLVGGHGRLELCDLLADLLDLLLGRVVLLGGGVEALLVGGELRGDLAPPPPRALGQGVGDGGVRGEARGRPTGL